ncbi:MAG: hypothetical protein HYS40_05685 [Gemmatimonadetes bacterium]|nr:hypothetical protein [Gemmatimonadota bacterium]
MLRKLGAIVLLVGLCLPYTCDIRPITGAWDDAASSVGVGIPVLVAVIYGLHTLVPVLARFHERHGQGLHGLLRMVYFVLAGFYLSDALRDTTSTKDQLATAAALAVTGTLLYWEQQRGTKGQRLPLLLLIVLGIPAISYFLSTVPGGVQVGAWVLTAGYLIATVAEVRALAGSAKITHGG